MFYKYALLTIGTLVIALAGYFFINGKEAPAFVVTISLTDDGFVPENITVQKGAKLVFKNDGQQPHWPASNFHPTHTLYPEQGGCLGSTFDACRGLVHGETFEYAVNEIGKWPLHDHLFPGLVMIVEVIEKDENQKTDAKKYDGKLPPIEEFKKLNYSDQLGYLKPAAKKGPLDVWDYVKKVFIVNGQVVGNAHEFAHIVGNSIYSKFGLRGITKCDDAFAYGCYHGVSEMLLQEKGVKIVKEVQDLCLEYFPPEKNHNYTGCIHGMGHGLLTFENMDLSKALGDCDQLDANYRNYCYDGIFMENSSQVIRGFDVNDPWKFCKDLPVSYHHNCARYQSQVFREQFRNDIKMVMNNCDKAPNDTLKNTCFESIGYYISQTALGKFDEIKSQCFLSAAIDGRNKCIIGSAKEVIFQRYQEWENTSEALCKVLSGQWLKECTESNTKLKEIYKIL